eukprot:8959454-Alexandrium_andersonii.AAC.1
MFQAVPSPGARCRPLQEPPLPPAWMAGELSEALRPVSGGYRGPTTDGKHRIQLLPAASSSSFQ